MIAVFNFDNASNINNNEPKKIKPFLIYDSFSLKLQKYGINKRRDKINSNIIES